MTRIVAGQAGGRRLDVPKTGTRPTSQRVREALFGRLEHYGVVEGARVIDLCAGSGALGLEAASRGAHEVILVDAARSAIQVCQRNIKALALPGVRAVTAQAASYLAGGAGGPADLVMLDPPYDMSEKDITLILSPLVRTEDPWLGRHSVVVVERSARSPEPQWPTGMRCFSSKTYGETQLWFAELDQDDAA